jgi:hypothetical protein
VTQCLVEIIDDFCVALHGSLQLLAVQSGWKPNLECF